MMTKIKDPNRMHCQAIYMEALLLFCYTLADSPGEKNINMESVADFPSAL